MAAYAARTGVYVISVAARLVAVNPRTLRLYDAEGFVRPARQNNLRLYSPEDIRRLLLIRHLISVEGVGLGGIRWILWLYDHRRFELEELFPALAAELREAGLPEPAEGISTERIKGSPERGPATHQKSDDSKRS